MSTAIEHSTQTVLVTGGAGYIGSVVVRHLLAHGKKVVVVDDLSRGHREALVEGVPFVEGSVCDDAVLDQAFSHQIDAIMHLAAYAYVGESMSDPGLYFSNNTGGMISLCRGAVRHGVKRLVFSSSCTVYGVPDSLPLTEDAPVRPCSPYGESKRQCEEILAWFGQCHGLRHGILRYFNAAGAIEGAGERHDPETHLIPLVLQVAHGERSHLSVFGTDYPTRDGSCERDYIHVADLADAHLLAVDGLEAHERLVVNLGTGQGATVREVIRMVEEVTGKPVAVENTPRRDGDPAALVACSDRARDMLGWVPKSSSLEQIVRDANRYYLEVCLPPQA